MRTLSMAAAAALALVALSGCLRNSDNVPPTVEEIARDDYARIAGGRERHSLRRRGGIPRRGDDGGARAHGMP